MNHKLGITVGGGGFNRKKSTDIVVTPLDTEKASHQSIRRYIDTLYDCYLDYLEMWPFLKSVSKRLDIGSFNIQRYVKGEHFKAVHAERMSLASSHRVLAWMTYLNTVEDGGSTLFPHYNLEIKPKRGQTLIWPAEWTHAHCGDVVERGSKYIITGWMHFPPVKL